ncbi:MAG: IS200/IS605 family accessory protein TnpB-related protein, partial [Bacillota bacterium]
FKERVTKELGQRVQAVREKLSQEDNSLPGEGKGMTRKVRRLLRRLDGKALVQNGMSCYSVWHDLRQLALSSR